MTAGEIEGSVTCGGQKRTEGTTGGGGGGGGNMTLSFTTLSTIAVQAGQSQIVVSVLKSGSLVHLQLVQVHPGLCEIGANKEENQMLMEEQQQLMEKLKKHEREVLSVVEKSQQKKQRKRRDEGLMEQRRSRKQEEDEGVHEAMVASLNEGWSLLLHLLERRQEVLRLASDFYCRSLEFAVSIDRIEDLQIRSDDQRPSEAQLTYDSMRRELLEKSLQVLTSSSRLLQKLKQLQRTEALQRRGGVLQDEEDEEEECSQCSSGMALRLEQLVETLQDRRRRADQAVRVQLQQVERGIVVCGEEGESRQAGSEDWSLSINEILDQNLQLESTSSAESTDLKSDSRTPETKGLQPGSRLRETAESRSEPTRVVAPKSRTEETKSIESGSRLGPKPESGSDLGSRLDENKDLKPESELDLESGSRLDSKPGSKLNEIRNLQSRFKLNLTAGSGSNLRLDSKSEPTRDLTSGSRSDMQPGFRLDVKPKSRSEQTTDEAPESTSEETKNLESRSRLEQNKDLQHETRPDLQSGSRSDLHPGLRVELKPGSRPRETRNLQSGFKLNLKAGSKSDLKPDSKSAESRDLLSGSRSDMELGSRLDVKSESRPETTRDVAPESTSEETKNFESRSSLDPDPESSSDVQPHSGVDVKPGSRSEAARDVAPESRLEEIKNFESGSRLDPEPESDLRPESRLKETKDLESKSKPDVEPGFRLQLKPGSRLKEVHNLQPIFKFSLKAGSTSGLKLDSKSEETTDLASGSDVQPGSGLDVNPKSRSEVITDVAPESTLEETKNLKSRSRLDESQTRPDLQSGSHLDFKHGFRSKETRNLPSGFKFNLKPGSRSDLKLDSKTEETSDLGSGSRSDMQPTSRSDLNPELKLEQTTGVAPESTSEETKSTESRSTLDSESESESVSDLKPGPTLDQMSGSGSDMILEPTRDMAPESTLEETKNIEPESRLEETKYLQPESRPDLQPESRPDVQPGSRSDVQPGSRLEFKLGCRPKETKNLQSGFKLNQSTGSRSDFTLDSKSKDSRDPLTGSTLEQMPESRSDRQPGPGVDVKPDSRLEPARDMAPESRSQDTTKSKSRTNPDPKPESNLRPGSRLDETKETESRPDLQSGSRSELENSLGYQTQSKDGHAHQVPLTNQRQQLLSSCERLVGKICSLVQQSSSVLSTSSAGQELSEAEDSLNTHLQLHTQAESAGQDAENLKQMLDQIRALHTDSPSRTSLQPPSEPSRQRSPLRALTEQLKRGGQTRTGTAQPAPPAADLDGGSLSPELIGQVDLVLKELQSLNMKIDSNLQLLKPYVTFLRTAQQVEDEVEELREEQDDTCWQETLQRVLAAQELGNNCINTVSTVSGAALDLQSVVSVVQKTMERLNRSKQEVTELQSQQQIQKQQLEHCRKHREKLIKTRQDLNCVSELLDSCTQMDLGSQLQTSKLLEQFSRARPHFTQLDAEVEYLERTWETQREVQDELELKLKGGAMKEEDLSELLKLQESVKNKIHESESILERSSSFHQTTQQLEALVQSDCQSPGTGSTGLQGSTEAELSRHKEEQQQIQNLFKTASALKADICTAVQHSGWTCFRVEQLEARLLSLDSLRLSWLNEAARREDKLRRELLTRRLSGDITQLRDSFKELKKRFNNLKFNYQKRNDRTRNTKAVRNQLQQVEVYEEKLQALRKRLQGVTARLGSEVKDGGVAREAEDAINELHRQMGDFERSVSEHQKTLEMTRRLQQAMEEYQFWCEEASATIARVSKFSSECRSTEAVSVLYQQFEKFVWPTVPQQEERISQIAELAVRLHGVEEGQRYIEKTVSKHSEMVESIRELSDGLMKLEAKLKLESLKKKQKDGESEKKEDRESEQRGEDVTEEKDEEKEKEVKGNIKSKKKEQKDNRSTQEAADMYELKETGHTPELSPDHDDKEVPMKRQTAAKRKPPLQKSRSLDSDRPMDRQTLSSDKSHRQQIYSDRFTSTHTFSISCSPVETNRRIHTIHSQLQPVTTEPQATPPPAVIGPMFSDIQRQFQKTELQETAQEGVHASCGSALLQDASAGSLSEADLQQQEVMIEDYFSNDEYECVSPDDISLPPLAETPESNMVQSDVEEGFCFSSHGVHISQYTHQCHVQSEHGGTGTGAGRQQRESSQTESCPTPPTSVHSSSSRLRSESNSFVQSPLTVPVPSQLTSTLCTILKTDGTSTANIPQSTELSMDVSGLTSPTRYNPFHKSNTTDSFNKNNVPEPLLKDHNSQYKQPQRSTGIQSKITQSVTSKVEILPQSIELNRNSAPSQSSFCPQPVSGPSPGLHRNMIPPQDSKFQKCYTTLPKTFHGSEDSLHQDKNSSQTKEETPPVFKPERDNLTNPDTRTIIQQTIYCQSSTSNIHHATAQASSFSSPLESPLPQGKTLPQIDPVPQTTDSVLHKDSPQDTGSSKSYGACPEDMPQDSSPPQASRSVLDQDVPSSKTGNKTSSVSIPKKSSLTKATIVTQQKNSHPTLHQAGSNLSSPREKSETLPKNNSVSQTRGFAQSSKDTEFIKSCPTLPQTSLQDSNLPRPHHESRTAHDQDVPFSKTSKEICLASMPKSSSLTTVNTLTIQTAEQNCQSSPPNSQCNVPQASSTVNIQQERPLSQSDQLPQTDLVLQTRGFAQSQRLTDSALNKDCATSLQHIPQEHILTYIDSRTGLDQDVPFSQSIKEPSSISMPQRSNLITPTTATQQTVYHQSSTRNSHCNVPQTCTNPMSVQGSPSSLGSGDLPEVHAPHLPELNSFSDISISSSDRFSSKHSHQTVYSLHKSLTSTSTQQCVHDPGMTPISPAKPTAAPQPEFQTQALAQQANLHVTSLSSPPHVLTPDQDPNICQPMAIREEIKITPQIQGPSIPAPPATPQAQAESLPQGKASKPGPPCITRPLSRATVMEGSPVMLEVEVTGHPEPMLTWLKDGEVSAAGPGRELAHEERKHLLFVPEAADSDGGSHEARAVCSCSGSDKWLVAQVFDIISEDWQTWFGTLCVLLWLIYLIVL